MFELSMDDEHGSVEIARANGYLYIAVFSNGTVKAGMASRDPRSRVKTHAHSGRAFGIEMNSAFYAAIYTLDTRVREREMHFEIAKLAPATSGREWFKFECPLVAERFASDYCKQVEQDSFAKRPSHAEIASEKKRTRERLDAMFKNTSAAVLPDSFPSATYWAYCVPMSKADLDELDISMRPYEPETVIVMARKITDFADLVWQHDESFEDRAGILHDAIMNPAFVTPKTFDDAMSIIKAASNYPVFFQSALTSTSAYRDEACH